MRDKSLAPSLQRDSCISGVYVDNISLLGDSSGSVEKHSRMLDEASRVVGLPLEWTYDHPVQLLETVGLVIDLHRGKVHNKPNRVWRFLRASQCLISRGKVRGEHLQVWVGHAVHLLMLLRPGLSVLRRVCPFIQRALGKRTVIPRDIRQEIRMVMGLVVLAEADLFPSYCSSVMCGDSSTYGLAVLRSTGDQREIREAWKSKERWIDNGLLGRGAPIQSSGHPGRLLGIADNNAFLGQGFYRQTTPEEHLAAGIRTGYGQFILASSPNAPSRSSADRTQARGKLDSDMTLIPSFHALADRWFDPSSFQLVLKRPWRCVRTHINVKEAIVCLLGLKHLARSLANHGQRAVILTDNQAALGALEKGRSRSFHLNVVCQQFAAYSIGAGIAVRMRYVNTKHNVADLPSRAFDPVKSASIPSAKSDGSVPLPCLTTVGQSTDMHSHAGPTGVDEISYCEWGNSGWMCYRSLLSASATRCALLLFAGTHTFGVELIRVGFGRVFAADITSGTDLLKRQHQDVVLTMIRESQVSFVCMTPPIIKVRPNRAKSLVDARIALFCDRVVQECMRCHIPWMLESPPSSAVWEQETISAYDVLSPN
eukprot:3108908-Amphidinium_carterae.1